MNGNRDFGAPQPFFQNRAPGQPNRLLLICQPFPPGQAAGALRWQKLSRYAAERGWAIDVLTLDPSDLDRTDLTRLDDLPAGIRLFGVRQPELRIKRVVHGSYRWLRDRRAEPVVSAKSSPAPTSRPRPDSYSRDEIRWIPRSTRDLARTYFAWLEYARDGRWARDAAVLAARIAAAEASPAGVISCGPPHMVHEAARRVARTLGIPFVIDMRDLWSLDQRIPEELASPLWYRLADHFERRAVAECSLVITNTEPARRAMQARYPEKSSQIIAVMNGFDDEPLPGTAPDDRFMIAYAGSIYLDRNPRALFRAAARVIRELELTPQDFGIELMGNVKSFDGIPLEVITAEEGLENFVRLHPTGSRQTAMQLVARASMLVSLPQDSELAIPSKVFEYMRCRAWLLALANRESATELLLRDTTADVVAPDDLEGLTAVLRKRYLQFVAGTRPPRIADDMEHYSRREQARLLFEAIEHYFGRPGPRNTPTRINSPLPRSA